METLANLECFVRSAEAGSFSAAARQLALTPAAVSRNVATLERNLGVVLFSRSTRRLALTDAGERFLAAIDGPLEGLQAAIAEVATERLGEATGLLRVAVGAAFGVDHILPLMPGFLAQHPKLRIEWRFDDRPVDLIADGFDAAIAGAGDPPPGVVARPLAPAHLVAVAAPAYMDGRPAPGDPSGLAALDGIVLRTAATGRTVTWEMQTARGEGMAADLTERVVVDDAAALRKAAELGLGATILSLPDALPLLERGALVRLIPDWYIDAGAISIYYPGRPFLPARTRVFVSHVVESFKSQRLAAWFADSLGSGAPWRKRTK